MTRRHSSRCALLGIVALTLASILGAAPARAEIPYELESLLPADPLVVGYTPSLGAMERDVVALFERFGVEGPDEDESIFSIFQGIAPQLAELEKVANPEGAFAVALRMVPGFPVPMFTVVFPLQEGLTEDDVVERIGVAPLAISGPYAAMGTDSKYAPANARQPMLAGIGDQDLSARLDVEGLFEALGPMVDMMLQMMLQQPTDDGRPPKNMAEEMEAITAFIELIRSGVGSIELFADVDASRIELGGGARFLPDGPLALGPQPSFDTILKESALLDDDDAILVASGIDLGNLRPLVDSLIEMMSETSPDGPGPYDAFELFQQRSLELWMTGLLPYVASFGMDESGLTSRWVESADAGGEEIAAVRELLSSMQGMGIVTTWQEPRTVAGFDVETVEIDVDVDAMTRADPDLDTLDDTERAMFEAVFERFMTPMTLASGHGKNVYVMDSDPARVDAFLERVASGPRGDVPARLEDARAWAGPDAQGLMAGDVRAFFDMLASFAAGVDDDEDAAAFVAGVQSLPSTPIYGASRVDGDWIRGRLSMETDALVAFIEAVQTLEGLD